MEPSDDQTDSEQQLGVWLPGWLVQKWCFGVDRRHRPRQAAPINRRVHNGIARAGAPSSRAASCFLPYWQPQQRRKKPNEEKQTIKQRLVLTGTTTRSTYRRIASHTHIHAGQMLQSVMYERTRRANLCRVTLPMSEIINSRSFEARIQGLREELYARKEVRFERWWS